MAKHLNNFIKHNLSYKVTLLNMLLFIYLTYLEVQNPFFVFII